MYTCTNILYDIRILRDCFILQRRQVFLLQSFPHDNEVLAPGLCQTVLWRKRVLQPISYFHTRPEVLLQHKREPREYSRRYCRPSQHTLCPPSSGAETYNKDLVVMGCLEFSDPCLRVVLSTSKRSKVLSAPQVSVKKIL